MNWTCPLNKRSDCKEPHAIGIDGGLKHYKSNMRPQLAQLGWLHVDNPTRPYYYEHDTTHPSYKEREIIGLKEDDDILKTEVL